MCMGGVGWGRCGEVGNLVGNRARPRKCHCQLLQETIFSWFFIVFSIVFSWFFFKELDFKELEIHRYSLMDTANEYQWISINEYQWISINKFIDGPSMSMVFFLWALLWALLWASIGPPLAPMGPGPPWGFRVDVSDIA